MLDVVMINTVMLNVYVHVSFLKFNVDPKPKHLLTSGLMFNHLIALVDRTRVQDKECVTLLPSLVRN